MNDEQGADEADSAAMDFDISTAHEGELASLICDELRGLQDRASMTQLTFGDVLQYKSQSDVSRVLSGERSLPVARAALLDEAGFKTLSGHTFVALATAQKNARNRFKRRSRNSLYDVFLASPMASAGDYGVERSAAFDLAQDIERWAQFRTYYAGSAIPSQSEFDASTIAWAENWAPLSKCRFFVLYLVKPIDKPSSIWVEAGIALAREIPSIYFVPGPSDLPYILRQASAPPAKGGMAKITVTYIGDEAREPHRLVRRHKQQLFVGG